MTAAAQSGHDGTTDKYVLTAERLQEWFDRFNVAHFGGSLPVPRLALSHSKKSLGTYRHGWKTALGVRRKTDHCIHVSTFYDRSESEYQDVLIHEMIHYYISLRNIRDDAPHGRRFREIMLRINAEGNRHIGVSTRGDTLALSASAARPRDRLILAMRTTDGGCFLSVVSPRHAMRIERIVAASSSIAEHSWHVSSDAAFASYSVVRTVRGRRVTLEEYSKRVETMQRIVLISV